MKHYENDSLKLEAARFLIENMEGAYSIDSTVQATCAAFYPIYREVMARYGYQIDKKCGEEIDSLWQVFCFVHSEQLGMERISDAERLKAADLIAEIDLAFKAWRENVYTRGCSFEEFCEYILPYRREEGLVIDDARREFYGRHHGDFYSEEGKDFIRETDSLLFLYKDLTHAPYYVPQIPMLTAAAFEEVKTGTCEQRCWFNSLLLSSLGMAVTVDFVPAWGNRNSGHTWNAVVVDGRSYAFESFWDENRWKYKRIYNNETCDSFWGKFRLPKVWRKTYANHQTELLSDVNVKPEDIPPFFRNAKVKDVSGKYFEAEDVRVELATDTMREVPSYAYLAVYNHENWVPVQWGKVKSGQAVFEKMGKDIVYLPVSYKEGRAIPAGVPFWLKADGTRQELKADGARGKVVVRNYAGQVPFEENRENLTLLTGCELWGMKDGKRDKRLFTLEDTLQIAYRVYDLPEPGAYRYVRLYLPSSQIALGEIGLYDGEELVDGARVTTPLASEQEGESVSLLTDGLSDTAFKGAAPLGYVDIDLGEERRLSRIGIMPYIKSWMDDASVYELAYWDNGWKAVGRKAGLGDYLVFEDVPANALLRLKDCKNPQREHHRIFLYEEGKVVWM